MTVKELFNEYKQYIALNEGHYEYLIDEEGFKEALIEFAKYHVQKALEEAHNTVYIEFLDEQGEPFDCKGILVNERIEVQANPSSILNAYPSENVK